MKSPSLQTVVNLDHMSALAVGARYRRDTALHPVLGWQIQEGCSLAGFREVTCSFETELCCLVCLQRQASSVCAQSSLEVRVQVVSVTPKTSSASKGGSCC